MSNITDKDVRDAIAMFRYEGIEARQGMAEDPTLAISVPTNDTRILSVFIAPIEIEYRANQWRELKAKAAEIVQPTKGAVDLITNHINRKKS